MIKFYDIDPEYVGYLKKLEKKIPDIDYKSNNKFVCGIVLYVNDIEYYAPLSHMTTKQRTNLLIYDNDKPIASIRFSFMMPAYGEVLTLKNFSRIKEEDYRYYSLLNKEYHYCLENEDKIRKKAISVYRIGCDKNHRLNKNCCDFRLLEQHFREFGH